MNADGRRSKQNTGDAALTRSLESWFGRAARVLPWRVPSKRRVERRDPYRSLIAEAMLQQTQVSRVVGKYEAFVERFPTAERLAAANLDDVLAMWSGLGYYRRARNLHAAAKIIVEQFDGRIPRTVEELRSLPGVGRYTAGAIASLAYDEAAPIVDGNVARVLLRIHGKDAASDSRNVQGWLWERATELIGMATRPGDFNEGLMELGATVCLPAPAAPRCEACPISKHCAARRTGKQLDIPRPKTGSRRTDVFCATVVIEREDGAVLVEQRPGTGMWAGLWQAPTIERLDRAPTRAEVARRIGIAAGSLRSHDRFEFHATHRRMRFEVFRSARVPERSKSGATFVRRELAERLALSSPQKRVILERAPRE